MCGIVGFLGQDRRLRSHPPAVVLLTMLERPGMSRARQRRRCRDRPARSHRALRISGPVRIAPADLPALDRLQSIGELVSAAGAAFREPVRQTPCDSRFGPLPASRPTTWKPALGARRGGLEVLSLGQRLDLVKQVGSPAALEPAMASPNGKARWQSATRECPPRAGSTCPTLSPSGLTECPTSRRFTTAT